VERRKRRIGGEAFGASPPDNTRGVGMPHVGWSLEQRAAVKRWMLFAYIFAFAGVILSAFLIATGNSGGWVVLFMTLCIFGALYMFIANIKKKQPR
jgi:FtsH-binding integral membrane protein